MTQRLTLCALMSGLRPMQRLSAWLVTGDPQYHPVGTTGLVSVYIWCQPMLSSSDNRSTISLHNCWVSFNRAEWLWGLTTRPTAWLSWGSTTSKQDLLTHSHLNYHQSSITFHFNQKRQLASSPNCAYIVLQPALIIPFLSCFMLTDCLEYICPWLNWGW